MFSNRFIKRHKLLFILLVDIVLLSFSYLLLIWVKPDTIDYFLPTHTFPFVIFMFIWVLISLATGKYNFSTHKKPIHLFFTISITTFFVISVVAILLLALQINQYSRLIIFGTVTLCYFLEIIAFRFLYGYLNELKENNLVNELINPNESLFISQRNAFENLNTSETIENETLGREELLKEESGVEALKFFSDHVNINNKDVVFTSTATAFNINNLINDGILSIINLKKVNEMRHINKFFIAVNSKLPVSGVFIGCVETSQQRYKRIESKYPAGIRHIAVLMDFIFHRVIPKISFFKQLYFNLTSGVKRTISKAEVLGRLVSCGFQIIEYKEIGSLVYFVVMKTGNPVFNEVPSYGPFYKMPRLGKDGKIIYVYKFRTMHPFSEYLQDYVLKLNGYSKLGKPAEDFRLTRWGKFLRKFWLDEFPQLINVLKGEMKLVGIRPVSNRALQDYPDDVKKLRIKYRPGCIPPYVSLLKQGFNESIEAERIYLAELSEKPFLTDLKYFSLALYNILTNKIRSA